MSSVIPPTEADSDATGNCGTQVITSSGEATQPLPIDDDKTAPDPNAWGRLIVINTNSHYGMHGHVILFCP